MSTVVPCLRYSNSVLTSPHHLSLLPLRVVSMKRVIIYGGSSKTYALWGYRLTISRTTTRHRLRHLSRLVAYPLAQPILRNPVILVGT